MFCRDVKGFQYEYQLLTTEEARTFKVKNPIIHSNVSFTSNTYFDLGLVGEIDGVILHNIFEGVHEKACPLLILEYENKGFIIISHYSLINNMEEYKDLLYEVIMYVYLNSYKTSEYKQE